MFDNWYEKFRTKCRRLGKKNVFCKGMAYIALFFAKLVYMTGCFFSQNSIRVISAICILLFFGLSTSFTGMEKEEKNTISNTEITETKETKEADMPMVVYANLQSNDALDISEAIADKTIDDIEVYDGGEIVFGDYEEELTDVEDESFSADTILDSNAHTYVIDEESGLSPDDWNLVLINKQHPVPDDYEFTLGYLYEGLQCDERVADNVLAMLAAAKKDGINLVINSPYRDYNLQVILFNRKIDKYMAMGYSYIEAYEIGSKTVTVPGASEHQIGLAFDITCDTFQRLVKEFGSTEAGLWLREHCKEYGFIIRYPEGKEYITGINYEPWHFRYVGVEAATIIMDNGITLEELLDELEEK